ncbi:MetQ/NlpA family ABC transporter substrate-binding protein [Gryllotalpicola ginsengisoli]|uniref:MetQ/NlpA family ABC transporter substrate-binding protein n=1 Tax=Gryllotalpicola ginsengisoli TaxID=444608 RepID=UPI0003B4E761|nr:MetQ/NlpA family ABC transporter substrate-binding protein [Gryllotalpicola ginsengisoli]
MSEPVLPPKLPEKPRRRTGTIVGVVIAAVVVIVAAVIIVVNVAKPDSSSAAGTQASDAKPQTVSIGVTDASQPYWKIYTELAKKKYNVTVKLVNFSDYSQPNPALKQKQTDLNEFQHIEFLADYNVKSGDDLQPIGPTAIYPLPLYSLKYQDPSDLPANAQVAIPNDAINEARGLLVLQSAGLLELKDGGSPFSTTADITSSKVKITTLDAAQTARALQSGSVVAAIVNKNYATDAGLPKSDIIAKDDPTDPSAQAYVNAFVARAEDKDNKLYQKLAALYLDPQVKKSVEQVNGGDAVFSDLTAKQLQDLLKKTEQQEKAALK